MRQSSAEFLVIASSFHGKSLHHHATHSVTACFRGGGGGGGGDPSIAPILLLMELELIMTELRHF